MEYSGLVLKYKINRPLTDEEHALRLIQKERLDVEPHYQLSVIKMNSTFLESVDKWFGWKGAWSTVMLIMIGMLLWFGLDSLTFNLGGYITGLGPYEKSEYTLFTFLDILFFAPLVGVCVWLLRKESFAWTHYPIRLNRKNRLLYVFRLNGTVLTAPWDEVFFTLGRGNRAFGLQNWDIRGHVLDKDGVTVRETFAFSIESSDQDHIRRHWEFLRRYMEDGPAQVIGQVELCLPIARVKETFGFGFKRLNENVGAFLWAYWSMLPFNMLFSLGRWFAMRTSKIPHWPQAVEDACQIEPGDPYVKDARVNSPDVR